jgi:IS30 family transposase
MAKNYKHLSKHERDRIAVWRGQGLSLREIARRLKRSPATLSRELKRNSAPIYTDCYLAHRAQARAEDRWREQHHKDRLKSARLRRYIRSKLKAGWSPELIAGRRAHLARRERVSHEAIYQ